MRVVREMPRLCIFLIDPVQSLDPVRGLVGRWIDDSMIRNNETGLRTSRVGIWI